MWKLAQSSRNYEGTQVNIGEIYSLEYSIMASIVHYTCIYPRIMHYHIYALFIGIVTCVTLDNVQGTRLITGARDSTVMVGDAMKEKAKRCI